MPSRTATGAANAAVSQETTPAKEGETSQALEPTQSSVPAEAGAIADVGLSQEMRDRLAIELQQALHAIEMGFDALTKPSDICDSGALFFIVDGVNVDNFVDKKTGEIKSKTVFRLQYEDGRVVNIMQSAARPRAVYATACETARLLGGRFKAGPFKMVKKGVGQIQDAIIFEPQPGWKQEVY